MTFMITDGNNLHENSALILFVIVDAVGQRLFLTVTWQTVIMHSQLFVV